MGPHIFLFKLTLCFFFTIPLLGHLIEEEKSLYLDEIFNQNFMPDGYEFIRKSEFSFWEKYGNIHLNKTIQVSLPRTPFCYRPFINGMPNFNQTTNIESTPLVQFARHKKKIGFIHDFQTSESNDFNNYPPFICDIPISNESKKISANHPSSILGNLPSVSLIPNFRFKNNIFSWENSDSLKKIKEEDALIPTVLLDAILQSNFELFFLQKRSPEQEEYSIFLDTIHSSTENQISKALPTSFSDLATYLIIGAIICMFISKYSKIANQEAFESRNIRNKNVNERKKLYSKLP